VKMYYSRYCDKLQCRVSNTRDEVHLEAWITRQCAKNYQYALRQSRHF